MKNYYSLLANRKYAEAYQVMLSLIPQKLYKFVSLTDDSELNDLKLRNLEEQTVFFSAIEQENDPYEFQAMYLDRDRLEAQGWGKSSLDALMNNYDLRTVFTIACFTANNENCLPMWAYYTNDYKGYCIEYNVINAARIHKVDYQPDRISIATIITCLFNAAREGNNDDGRYYRELLRQTAFIKHTSWSWENEYRILGEKEEVNSKGSSVSLLKTGLQISKVVAGINCNQKHKERIQEICLDHSYIYRQAVISKTSFGFEEE